MSSSPSPLDLTITNVAADETSPPPPQQPVAVAEEEETTPPLLVVLNDDGTQKFPPLPHSSSSEKTNSTDKTDKTYGSMSHEEWKASQGYGDSPVAPPPPVDHGGTRPKLRRRKARPTEPLNSRSRCYTCEAFGVFDCEHRALEDDYWASREASIRADKVDADKVAEEADWGIEAWFETQHLDNE